MKRIVLFSTMMLLATGAMYANASKHEAAAGVQVRLHKIHTGGAETVRVSVLLPANPSTGCWAALDDAWLKKESASGDKQWVSELQKYSPKALAANAASNLFVQSQQAAGGAMRIGAPSGQYKFDFSIDQAMLHQKDLRLMFNYYRTSSLSVDAYTRCGGGRAIEVLINQAANKIDAYYIQAGAEAQKATSIPVAAPGKDFKAAAIVKENVVRKRKGIRKQSAAQVVTAQEAEEAQEIK